MQKLVFIAFVFLVTACRKEIASNTHTSDKQLLRSYVKKIVPDSTIQRLDWENTTAIETKGITLGYQVPLFNPAETEYEFLLVNYYNGLPGGIYQNRITYKSQPLALVPVSISNYNYGTRESFSYDTRQLIQSEPDQVGMVKPWSLMSAGLRLAAVTFCGVYQRQPGQAEVLKGMNAYMLAYLLGLEDGLVDRKIEPGKGLKPNAVLYYNPLHRGMTDSANPSLMEWDIAR